MAFGKADPKNPSERPTTEKQQTPSTATSSAPVAASASTPAQPERKEAAIQYVDRPDVAETFADAVTGVTFDGQTLRLEFAVTRLDQVKLDTAISGRRYPVCRVVLPPIAAVDLINRIQQIAAALKQAGMVKATPPRGSTPETR